MIADRVTIVIGFEGGMRFGTSLASADLADPANVMVVGPHSNATVVRYERRLQGMSVALEPWVAFVLFGVPMHRLANSVLRASDVLGAEILGLRTALKAASSWMERFVLLEEFLVTRFANGWTCSPSVVQAWRELSRTDGSMAVEELASRVGWCRRNLERRFREQIGLSPKAVARTLRLRRACRLLIRGLATSEVALACQYYDQAHFAHDFKRLTAHTPSEFLSEHAEEGPNEGYPAVFSGLIT